MLLRTAAFTIGLDLSNALVDGIAAQDRPRDRSISAMLEGFECSDGRWIQFAMPDTGDAWPRFCRALDREDLIDHEDYARGRDRYRHMAALIATLAETIASMPFEHWAPRLDEHRCIWAPINDSASAVQDPQVRATGAFETIHHPTAGEFETVAAPFRMPLNDEVGVRGPAPDVGEHTDEILADIGLSPDQIRQLHERGIV